MRSSEAVANQIAGLQRQREKLPEYSMFGDPNWQGIDAQIEILKGNSTLEDFPEGNWEDMDEENKVYRAAEEADQWLDDDDADNLYED